MRSSPHRCVCLRRSGSLLVPQPVQQVTAAYVSITTLLLSAHDLWEQADQIALRGSGETGSEVTAESVINNNLVSQTELIIQ